MNFFLQESTSDRWLLPYYGIVLKALWVFLSMWQKRNTRGFKRDSMQMMGICLRIVPWKIRVVSIFFAEIAYQSNRAHKSVEEALFNHWLLRHVLEERSFVYDRRSNENSSCKNQMQWWIPKKVYVIPEEMMLNVVDMGQISGEYSK